MREQGRNFLKFCDNMGMQYQLHLFCSAERDLDEPAGAVPIRDGNKIKRLEWARMNMEKNIIQ